MMPHGVVKFNLARARVSSPSPDVSQPSGSLRADGPASAVSSGNDGKAFSSRPFKDSFEIAPHTSMEGARQHS